MTYKYRLYPTKSQAKAFQTLLDCCRWVYNKGLETRKGAYETEGKSLTRYETVKRIPQWKAEHPFLLAGHAQAMQEALTRLDLAFRAFFQRVKKGDTPGYPRFRSYRRYDSFTYPQPKGNWRFLDNGRVRLSKVGAVTIKMHRPIMGEAKTLTIRRDSVGNWYACFSCEVDPQPLPPNHNVVGIDLGLTTFAYMSNGETIERQRWMKRDAQDIARLQRKKEKFVKGSSQRRKVIKALCHAYERVSNRRKNFAHQESRKLVNQYQFMAFEQLEIREMQINGNKTISKGIADVAWAQFVQSTTYKAAYAGRGVALVNPRGTTQACSGCGQVVTKDLHIRIHDCPHCGLRLNRDHNAALNILARGLASVSPGSPGVVEALLL